MAKTLPKRYIINATDQIPGHTLYQMPQNEPNAKQTLADSQDTNNCLQKMLLTRLHSF